MFGKRSIGMAGLALAAAVTLTACGDGGDQDQGASTTSPTASSEVSDQSTGDATSAQGEHNDADVSFAQGMIPHHAQAIEMSDMMLAKDGVDERVRSLAEEIKAAQAPEIEQMTGWLKAWGAEVPQTGDSTGMDHSGMGQGGDGMTSGDGMMTAEDMQALADADGASASRLFLEQMIAHHRGAIQMAETEVAQGKNEQATELAQTIIDTQQAEIEQMQSLLNQL